MRKGNVRSIVFLFTAGILLTAGPTAPSQESVPMLINYQGELRDPTSGEPVPDGEYNMTFLIYDLQFGGTPLWQSSHDSTNGNPIQIQDGIFKVLLGSGTGDPLSASLFNGADRWLEMVVEGETLEPRQRLASVPYAIVSENSRLLDGQAASNFASASHLHSGSDIVDGVVSEKWIDAAIARDSELSAHAADSAAHHKKTTTFAELTDTAAEAQIPAGIARDAEILPAVLAGDGAGSTLDADLLDGKDSSAFALSGHTHAAVYWGLTGNSGTNPATHFLGTADNQAVEFRVNGARALRLEPGESPNIVAGYADNAVTPEAVGATIAGGGQDGFTNSVAGSYGTIGGGRDNQAAALSTTVGGGQCNTASGLYATVGGGAANTASGILTTVAGGEGNEANRDSATVGGGHWNTASSPKATVGGGDANQASADWATVGGGHSNTASGLEATVGGGGSNRASNRGATVSGGMANYAMGDGATVGGGWRNDANGEYATVGGGTFNTASGEHATVGGGRFNETNAAYATIAGGGPLEPDYPETTRNLVTDDYGTIGGGGWNQAGDNAGTTTDAMHATVAGGGGNVASGASATVGGGSSNAASGGQATVAGGSTNTASSTFATVGGGSINTASNYWATVGGGNNNKASGHCATVGGGLENTAGGSYATVPGGQDNIAKGDHTFAAGRRAVAGYDGCFVWGDSLDVDIEAWQANEFVARATGGFWFITKIDEKGEPIEGMRLPAGSSKWVPIGTTAAQFSPEKSDYVQELEAENTSLQARVDDLESRLVVLEALMHSGGAVQK